MSEANKKLITLDNFKTLANTKKVVHTVVKGDTLWAISKKYLEESPWNTVIKSGVDEADIQAMVEVLTDANKLPNPNKIVVGQKINITGSVATKEDNTSSKPKIVLFGRDPNTDRLFYAQWEIIKQHWEKYGIFDFQWDKEGRYVTEIDHFEYVWEYKSESKPGWWNGNSGNSDADVPQCTYTADDTTTKVRFRVKAIPKTHGDNDTPYFIETWSDWKEADLSDTPPEAPSTPSVTIKNGILKWTLDGLNIDDATDGTTSDVTYDVSYEIVQNNNKTVKTGTSNVSTSHSEGTYTVSSGSAAYKVRCCIRKKDKDGKVLATSEWSDYSNNVYSVPAQPKEIKSCSVESKLDTGEFNVLLTWDKVAGAETYEIEYTDNETYFDSNTGTISVTGIDTLSKNIILSGGKKYFFRLRAVNEGGESKWTSTYKSVALGENPLSPITRSSTLTAMDGELITLFWTHNPKDESKQTKAHVEVVEKSFSSEGEATVTQNFYYNSNNTDNISEKLSCSWTSDYNADTEITWRVRTAGVTGEYGEWSIVRTIRVYKACNLNMKLTSTETTDVNGWVSDFQTVESFPFYLTAASDLDSNSIQTIVGYHVTVTVNSVASGDKYYDIIDSDGQTRRVIVGEKIYSKYIDGPTLISEPLSANNIDLQSQVSYDITVVAALSSGLTISSTLTFDVNWTDVYYEPDAVVVINEDSLTADISPYCRDTKGDLVEDVVLSVYRREFDGSLIEIGTNIENDGVTTVIDPHPALDYARYRVIATTKSTGAVRYYDLPSIPVGEKAAVIQWAETWSNFEAEYNIDAERVDYAWAGSMVKLPYNIDVSDANTKEVSLIKYAGRKRPVSYYGTQLGETQTWNVDIPKSDKETLYALRRLAIWMGDVYVREPSGSGYWATVSVSFSQKHCNLVIPVSIDITRVEGDN